VTTISVEGLAGKIRQMAAKSPKVAELAMREAALELSGPYVQAAIDASEPYVPVDLGQYRGSWRVRKIAGGARVYSIAKHAVWIERGRLPGPVSVEGRAAIRRWTRRKLLRTAMAKRLASRKVDRIGGTKVLAARAKKGEREELLDQLTEQVIRKIESQGYAPRWVLRRAVDSYARSGAFRRTVMSHFAQAMKGAP
jgi:hypothetical protein